MEKYNHSFLSNLSSKKCVPTILFSSYQFILQSKISPINYFSKFGSFHCNSSWRVWIGGLKLVFRFIKIRTFNFQNWVCSTCDDDLRQWLRSDIMNTSTAARRQNTFGRDLCEAGLAPSNNPTPTFCTLPRDSRTCEVGDTNPGGLFIIKK